MVVRVGMIGQSGRLVVTTLSHRTNSVGPEIRLGANDFDVRARTQSLKRSKVASADNRIRSFG